MKKILTAIKTKLATVPAIKHVALWRNQIDKMEDGKQDFMAFPAVFVEFLPATFSELGGGERLQQGSGTIRVHIVGFELQMTDEQILDLPQTVYAALQGLKDDAQSFSPLTRIADTPDNNITNVLHWQTDYSCIWNDDSAQPSKQPKTLTRLVITKEIN